MLPVTQHRQEISFACGRYVYLLVRSGIAPPAVAWLAFALVTSDKRIAPGYRCAAPHVRQPQLLWCVKGPLLGPGRCLVTYDATAKFLKTLRSYILAGILHHPVQPVRRWTWAVFAVLGTLGSQVLPAVSHPKALLSRPGSYRCVSESQLVGDVCARKPVSTISK